jgi:hypothetical protein
MQGRRVIPAFVSRPAVIEFAGRRRAARRRPARRKERRETDRPKSHENRHFRNRARTVATPPAPPDQVFKCIASALISRKDRRTTKAARLFRLGGQVLEL